MCVGHFSVVSRFGLKRNVSKLAPLPSLDIGIKSALLGPLDRGNLSPRRLLLPNGLDREGFVLCLMTLVQPATKYWVLTINETMENSLHRSVCQFN